MADRGRASGGGGRIGPGTYTGERQRTPGALAFHNKASSSVYGTPLAIVFGTQRVPGSIICAGLFNRNVGYPTMGTGVVQVALCEGEIVSCLAIWREKVKSTPAGLGVTIATGTIPQSPWSWMTTNFPAFALGYGGVATASCDTGFTTAATGELERASYEIRGLNSDYQDGSSTAYDAPCANVIAQLLESTIFGLGWDASLVDIDTSIPFRIGAGGTSASGYPTYCQANGWFIGLALTEQRPAREVIGEILTATDSVALWSEGKLKVRPLGEAEVVGTVTYTPYTTPQYDLGAIASSGENSDFLASSGDPWITAERVPRADAYNCHPVEWSNRFPVRKDTTGATISEPFNAYNAWVEDGVPDPVDVEAVGLRKASPVSLRCITREVHAKAISSILTKRALHTERNSYRFSLGWRYALLEPTDLVTLTDSVLGISRRLVRITEIEEQEDGSFDVVAEEVGTITAAASAVYTVT
jgi:hypothetical protein